MGDVLLNSTFPEEEVELTRTRTLSGLRAQEAQPAFLATKYFDAALYGDHPYGRTATSASVGSITRDDIVAYQTARLRPGGSVLVVAGDLGRRPLGHLLVRGADLGAAYRELPLEFTVSRRSELGFRVLYRQGGDIKVAGVSVKRLD